ncbi:MAG: adenylate/guanylate cyclase domain-containing protein [Alphaproteobacteria bacterium]|nr:adenylate/guanylate cyclase domain-containing protein [Alphaproteobacteria bacterium]
MSQPDLERKLAAILYADVAGYSRLMGEDEDGTHRILSAYLDTFVASIEGHGGRAVHFAGDAVLADFSSVTSALTCAIAVQRDLAQRNQNLADDRKVQFRIGINLGDVIVDRDDIYGDGVNVAARLEGLSEVGGICISGTVFDQVEGRVDCGFAYMGAQKVKNIRKPVLAYGVLLDPAEKGKVIGAPSARPAWTIPAAAVFVAAAVGAAVWFGLARPPGEAPMVAEAPLAMPDRPSIAVLPFANESGDAAQDYFADGLTDDLIIDLSKVSGLFVIARNSVFAYKGKPVTVQEVAKRLGVKYVLEGSVRKAGGQVRINAKLIDAMSGQQLWADRYDGTLKDIFMLQDDVVGKIVSALSVELTEDDMKSKMAAVKETASPDAYDFLLRGLQYRSRFKWKDALEARELFAKALEQDPNYARAAIALGNHYYEAWRIWGEPRDENLNMAIEHATKAATIDPGSPLPHVLLAQAYFFLGRYGESEGEARKALALNPSDADALASLADFMRLSGRPEEAVDLFKRAMRLDPLFPAWQLAWLGHAYFMTGAYDEAIQTLKRGVRRDAGYIAFHLFLAASHAASGNLEEAKREAAEVLKNNPEFTLEAYTGFIGHKNPADLERDLAAMRKAGLPD